MLASQNFICINHNKETKKIVYVRRKVNHLANSIGQRFLLESGSNSHELVNSFWSRKWNVPLQCFHSAKVT